jgi:predicted nucleic acid-binding protein
VKISTLIDANVLLDVWGSPGQMTAWSEEALIRCRDDGALVINTVIWSEIAPSMARQELLDAYSAELDIEKEHVPWDAAFQAGLTHALYRRAGGARERTLPDFIIGAHALAAGHRLLTRDPARYRTYFPTLSIVAPDTHP